jgi:hypothetical protein
MHCNPPYRSPDTGIRAIQLSGVKMSLDRLTAAAAIETLQFDD